MYQIEECVAKQVLGYVLEGSLGNTLAEPKNQTGIWCPDKTLNATELIEMVVVLSESVIKSTENMTMYGFLWRTEKTCGPWGDM